MRLPTLFALSSAACVSHASVVLSNSRSLSDDDMPTPADCMSALVQIARDAIEGKCEFDTDLETMCGRPCYQDTMSAYKAMGDMGCPGDIFYCNQHGNKCDEGDVCLATTGECRTACTVDEGGCLFESEVCHESGMCVLPVEMIMLEAVTLENKDGVVDVVMIEDPEWPGTTDEDAADGEDAGDEEDNSSESGDEDDAEFSWGATAATVAAYCSQAEVQGQEDGAMCGRHLEKDLNLVEDWCIELPQWGCCLGSFQKMVPGIADLCTPPEPIPACSKPAWFQRSFTVNREVVKEWFCEVCSEAGWGDKCVTAAAYKCAKMFGTPPEYCSEEGPCSGFDPVNWSEDQKGACYDKIKMDAEMMCSM